MKRESRLWLIAAGAVAVVVAAVVLVFGYTRPPGFPDMYSDGGPSITGTFAYLEYGPEDCVWVFDVATGESRELYCDNWAWPESWDDDGNLRVHAGNGHEQVLIVELATGDIIGTTDPWEGPPPDDEGGPPPEEVPILRSRSSDGRVTLTHGTGPDAVTVIDIEAPRNYSFYAYGLTDDGNHAWVCDSEDRLLVAALDGNSEPWLVTDGVSDPIWK